MKKFLEQNKKIIIGIGVICIMIICYMFKFKDSDVVNESQEFEMNMEANTEVNTNEEISKEKIVVHVAGAVKKPGIVEVEKGSRISDAIEASGGLRDDADISEINLAYVVEDGIKVQIPSTFDEKNEGDTVFSGMEKEIKDNKIVNINKATSAELETLTGIGPSLASKIVLYREKNGKFKKIEDIKNVSGIGENKYEKIKNLITIK